MKLAIHVISDVICPWCYIGKRRLERAIALVNGRHEFQVRWLPYELNPALPAEGLDRREYRIRKFGSWERSRQLDAQVAEAGRGEGIAFDFDRIERTPNTRDAHRLIRLADQAGCQDAVVEGLFRAYFTAGRDLTQRPTLVDVVVEAGLDRQQVDRLLDSDEGIHEIQQEVHRARTLGVQGVPFFILQDSASLSGAQPAEAFLEAFRQFTG